MSLKKLGYAKSASDVGTNAEMKSGGEKKRELGRLSLFFCFFNNQKVGNPPSDRPFVTSHGPVEAQTRVCITFHISRVEHFTCGDEIDWRAPLGPS